MFVMGVNSLTKLSVPVDIFITFSHCSKGEFFPIYN